MAPALVPVVGPVTGKPSSCHLSSNNTAFLLPLLDDVAHHAAAQAADEQGAAHLASKDTSSQHSLNLQEEVEKCNSGFRFITSASSG